MAIRTILKDGEPGLLKTSRPVEQFDDRLHTLLDDMQETMLWANGIGLAAPQVGVLRRVILVMDIEKELADEEEEPIYELINPVILEQSGEEARLEGCLSIPGFLGAVTRSAVVKVRAQDRNGTFFELTGEGMTARALLHEIDHLDGRLFKELADKLIPSESLEA